MARNQPCTRSPKLDLEPSRPTASSYTRPPSRTSGRCAGLARVLSGGSG